MFLQETCFGSIYLGPAEFKIRCRTSFPICLVLDIEFISYLATLMKFYIARKPTFKSRSLVLELTSIGFLIKADFLNNLL
ncbi:hypothetical protein BK123_12420 [Paenibacillus lautus]|uniref:Uncharacterized protein n=1 Tax=Paenibacillus lautus TaxID=1401 RepID=A0A1R1B1N5_PAELA|nr:hypothetical protein BK123_12420 [Paenibacillus lautus]